MQAARVRLPHTRHDNTAFFQASDKPAERASASCRSKKHKRDVAARAAVSPSGMRCMSGLTRDWGAYKTTEDALGVDRVGCSICGRASKVNIPGPAVSGRAWRAWHRSVACFCMLSPITISSRCCGNNQLCILYRRVDLSEKDLQRDELGTFRAADFPSAVQAICCATEIATNPKQLPGQRE